MLEIIIGLVIGVILGGVVGGLLMHFHAKGLVQQKAVELESRAIKAEAAEMELRSLDIRKDAEIVQLREKFSEEQRARVKAETELEESRRSIAEQRRTIEEAKKELKDAFDALSAAALRGNRQEFLTLAKDSMENLLRPLRETLDRYETGLREMEDARAKAYGTIETHIRTLTAAQRTLEQALRAPTVRGKWGEVMLEQVVRFSGLSEPCIERQVSVSTDDHQVRPDLVVRFPGDRCIIVDAKVPLEAYMAAMETQNTDERARKLKDHAAAVRTHMKSLSAKAYWSQFPSAEYVVLFLSAESFLSAALEGDPALLADGMESRVLLATPTTLIANLLTIAHTWQEHRLAENAKHIAEAGTVLYERLCKFMEYFAEIGKALKDAARSYNEAVGSWESRLAPGARKLKELGAGPADAELPGLPPIDVPLRQLPPAEGGNDEIPNRKSEAPPP